MASARHQQRELLKDLLKNLREGGGINQSPLYQSGSNFLQGLLSNEPNAFASFEAPFLQNFQQQIVPQLSERFAGMGTGAGGLSSSGFQNSLAQAGSGLQNQLASLRGNLQMQALPSALNYAQQPFSNLFQALQLQPQYKNQKGFGEQYGADIGQALISLLPMLLAL